MGITSRTGKVQSIAATGETEAEGYEATQTSVIHKRKDTVNSKANQHRVGQRHFTSEPQRERHPVLTPAQKRALSEQLSAQVAEHVANGGKVDTVWSGETALPDGQHPLAVMNRSQKRNKANEKDAYH